MCFLQLVGRALRARLANALHFCSRLIRVVGRYRLGIDVLGCLRKMRPHPIVVIAAASVLIGCKGSASIDSGGDAWTQAQTSAFRQFKERGRNSRADVVHSVASAFPVAFSFDTMQPIPAARPLTTRAELIRLLGEPEAEFSLAEEPTYASNGRAPPFDPAEMRFLVYDIDCLIETPKYQADERMCTTMDAISLQGLIVRVTLTTDFIPESKKWLFR